MRVLVASDSVLSSQWSCQYWFHTMPVCVSDCSQMEPSWCCRRARLPHNYSYPHLHLTHTLLIPIFTPDPHVTLTLAPTSLSRASRTATCLQGWRSSVFKCRHSVIHVHASCIK